MDRNFHLFRRVWAASALALFAATWKLWTPQHVFPQVPALAQLGQLPDVVDWITLGAIAIALLAVLLAPTRSTLWQQAMIVFTFAAALLIAIDQHRFQPWTYQFVIIAVVLATAKPPAAFKLLRWLTIGIYFWSAWSKCDFTFTHNLGQQFLKALLGWADFESWPTLLRLVLVSLFPAVEFAIALSLCFPRLWPKAVGASIALHVLLLIALGPLGLHHKPGVLLWNVYFIVQNLLIFRASPEKSAVEMPRERNETVPPDLAVDHPSQNGRIPAGALFVVAAALVWPLLETWNYCDHWPAWSVYSPRVERTSVFIHRSEQDRLPAPLHRYLEPAADDESWFLVRFDLWSLESLDAPLYPQNRFQIAAAAGLAHQFGITQVRAVRFSSANRWNGKRESKTFTGLGELESATRDYVVGARTMRELVRHH